MASMTTTEEPGLVLTAPDPVKVLAPEKASGLVPLKDEQRSQLDEKRCTFKTGKLVLQQPVDRDQVKKLLAKGKTDLLTQFISKAGKPFPAHLKLAERGKVEFEFPDQ